MINLTRKNTILLICSFLILLAIVVFSIINWDLIHYLFEQLFLGVEFVGDYVKSLGFGGLLCIALVILVCFFFPVISSVPI